MNASEAERCLDYDRQHVWHPYAAQPGSEPRYLVTGTEGVYLELCDGRRLIDGISSWWTAILGHRHPELVRAAQTQLERLPHVDDDDVLLLLVPRRQIVHGDLRDRLHR